MPSQEHIPAWVRDLQLAASTDARIQPWKPLVQEANGKITDTFDVQRDQEGTRKAVP
ncbi:uncharacterized protein RAG0_13677 [Rhynchosporium agropyri]|uniref:Uncharacterized protein n=2 Tax=Rhynchosporium TaxID=38037 RepID=A0A1E1LDN9_9HELO|nr:uncharacterized protein RCO7_14893 [Rhynchosporium commune]CZT08663.1 uncharacterized protein RAG0_13677 [Rhynchosporium agropyri]